MGVIVVVYMFILILGGNAISYLTRKLPSKFQESSWIAYAMISTFQVFAIGLPLMALATGEAGGGNVSASFATRSTFVFLTNISILSFIFGPKVAEHYGCSRASIMMEKDFLRRGNSTMSTKYISSTASRASSNLTETE